MLLNTHTIVKTPPHTLTHALQNDHSTRYTANEIGKYTQVLSVQGHLNVYGTFVPKNFTVTHFSSLHFKTESRLQNKTVTQYSFSLNFADIW